MLIGFVLTFYTVFLRKNKKFMDRWVFRTLHLLGIFYVGSLNVLDKYCPLTIFENHLRMRYSQNPFYPDSFLIVYYIEKLVYPDVNPLIIQIPTLFIAVFTLVVFVIRPPEKINMLFKKMLRIINLKGK
jgi:hypothetical protein